MNKFLIVMAVIFFAFALLFVAVGSVKADGEIYIKQGSLSNHACNDTEWHIVITQVSPESLAPASVHVVWANGNEADIPLTRVTGGVAHYFFYINLDSPVVNAWTTIYDGWAGEFNLSHGPCGFPTPTSTFTPTNTFTYTPSATSTSTSTSTPTSTSTSTPPTETPGTETPTPEFTYTQTPDPNTPTIVFTYTRTPGPSATPEPPVPADTKSDAKAYYGKYIGSVHIGESVFILYDGIKGDDGALVLPSEVRGAALYQNTIWVHRLWKTGWLEIKVGDIVYLHTHDDNTIYRVSDISFIEYGKYPENSDGIKYIATCYSENGEWAGVELYKLELLIGE